MTNETNYLELLEHSFEMEKIIKECPPISRLEFLSRNVFDFTTYDFQMDELFAKKAIECCEAITNGTTFEYIEDSENHKWFLLMCNMPFFYEKIEWGTSIRGAWWDQKIELKSYGIWVNEEQCFTLTFTKDEWRLFICAITCFIQKDSTGVLE